MAKKPRAANNNNNKTGESAPVITQVHSPVSLLRYVPFALAILAFIIYANTLGHGFALDDVAVISNNKFVQQGLAGIPRILTTFYWQGYWDLNAGLYRPLSLVMFAVEWQISPGSPFIHHLVQVLLYALTIMQLYRFLNHFLASYNPWLPAAVTLLFALHPIHTEVVANIKSRDEILCFLFFILTANELLKKQRVTVAAIVFYILCLLSKEAGLLYLPVFMILLVQVSNVKPAKAAASLTPLAIAAAGWLGWHYFVTHNLSPARVPYTYADNSLLACPGFVSRLSTGLVILGRYLLKSIWPYTMSYDYSFSQIPCEDGLSLAAIATVAVCCGLLYVAWKQFRKTVPLSFGILYFFCTIFLASNIVFLIGSTMGDRLLFAPSLGSAICLGWLAYRYMGQLPINTMLNRASLTLLAIALAYGLRTVGRNTDWQSNATLFAADMANAPGSARVLYNRSTTLLEEYNADKANKAALAEATDLLQRSVAIDSGYRDAFVNLGAAYYKAGNYPQAIAASQRALELSGTDSSARTTIGDCYFMMNRTDDAIAIYQWALAKGIKQTKVYTFLGSAYFKKGLYNDAIATFHEGVTFDSSSSELWGNYGNALGVTGRYDEALNAFSKSLRIKPGQKNILNAMAITYANKGDSANAKAFLEKSRMP